jgi:pimeloyl-ACP methyl ester carboxylesterase
MTIRPPGGGAPVIDAQWFERELQKLPAAELYALKRAAADVGPGGNANGVWDEGGAKLLGPPAVQDLEAKALVGVSKKDEARFVAKVLAQKLEQWGANTKLTDLRPGDIPSFERFVARKVIELARYERHPSEVQDLVIHASGKVDGVKGTIPPTEVFAQRIGPPKGVERNGDVAVVVPGFQETGRHYLDVVDELTKKGYDVLVMDQIWSGHTQGGEPGGMDTMLQAAMAVAAVTAKAEEIRTTDPELAKKGGKVGIMAISMGGESTLLAQALRDSGRLHLDGASMPEGVPVAAIAPFGKATPEITNAFVKVLGKAPVVKDMALKSLGFPILTDKDDAKRAHSQEVMLEGITGQASTMIHGEEGGKLYRELIEDGVRPKGPVMLVHAKGDRLADFEASEWLHGKLGKTASELVPLEGKNHVFQQSAAERPQIIAAFDRLMRG